jgi:ribosome recycling factor
MNHYGGVTMIRPKNVKIGNPLFLICHANHYVPFHSSKVKITKYMRQKLEDIEKKQKAGQISEDDKFRLKEEVQKKMDSLGKEIEEMTLKKEKEIKS